MGYSTIYGEISFEPPLVGRDLKDVPKTPLFELAVQTEEVEHELGTLEKVRAGSIVCRWDECIKAYTVVEDLAVLVSHLPNRAFSGEFRIEGEDVADIRRVFIRDGRVVEWRPEIVWPDGKREQAA